MTEWRVERLGRRGDGVAVAGDERALAGMVLPGEIIAGDAEDGRIAGRRAVAEMYEERAREYRRYGDTIRRAVLNSMRPPEPSGDEGGQDQA